MSSKKRSASPATSYYKKKMKIEDEVLKLYIDESELSDYTSVSESDLSENEGSKYNDDGDDSNDDDGNHDYYDYFDYNERNNISDYLTDHGNIEPERVIIFSIHIAYKYYV